MDPIPVPGVHTAPDRNLADLRREFDSGGWSVFVLPAGISDKESFFEAMCAVCPLDPPLKRVRLKWDALKDSLWGGFDSLAAKNVAVLWPDPQTMKRESPEDYILARQTMSAVADALADSEATLGEPTHLVFVLIEKESPGQSQP